jgi:hypothetical protein
MRGRYHAPTAIVRGKREVECRLRQPARYTRHYNLAVLTNCESCAFFNTPKSVMTFPPLRTFGSRLPLVYVSNYSEISEEFDIAWIGMDPSRGDNLSVALNDHVVGIITEIKEVGGHFSADAEGSNRDFHSSRSERVKIGHER